MALSLQTFRQFDPPFRIEAGIVSRCCVSQEIALKEHRVGKLNDCTGMHVVPTVREATNLLMNVLK